MHLQKIPRSTRTVGIIAAAILVVLAVAALTGPPPERTRPHHVPLSQRPEPACKSANSAAKLGDTYTTKDAEVRVSKVSCTGVWTASVALINNTGHDAKIGVVFEWAWHDRDGSRQTGTDTIKPQTVNAHSVDDNQATMVFSPDRDWDDTRDVTVRTISAAYAKIHSDPVPAGKASSSPMPSDR